MTGAKDIERTHFHPQERLPFCFCLCVREVWFDWGSTLIRSRTPRLVAGQRAQHPPDRVFSRSFDALWAIQMPLCSTQMRPVVGGCRVRHRVSALIAQSVSLSSWRARVRGWQLLPAISLFHINRGSQGDSTGKQITHVS